jgi:glycogen phosphorylase
VPEELSLVISVIKAGRFGDPAIFRPLLDTLNSDFYLIANDFVSYLQAQTRADAVYADPMEWAQRSIASAACMGRFSSDRSIREYAQEIWKLESCCPI